MPPRLPRVVYGALVSTSSLTGSQWPNVPLDFRPLLVEPRGASAGHSIHRPIDYIHNTLHTFTNCPGVVVPNKPLGTTLYNSLIFNKLFFDKT